MLQVKYGARQANWAKQENDGQAIQGESIINEYR
jgi:hypothetical protein